MEREEMMNRKITGKLLRVVIICILTGLMSNGITLAISSLDDNPLHQLPATFGKVSMFSSYNSKTGQCQEAAWKEYLGSKCCKNNLNGCDSATKDWYVAMRWPYYDPCKNFSNPEAKSWWHNKKILVTNPNNGKQVVVAVKDWGPCNACVPRCPKPAQDRVIDLSETALKALGVKTDDQVYIEFAEQNAPLGPLPDLIVQDIWVSPSKFRPGSKVKLKIRFKNIGGGDVISTFEIVLYFDKELISYVNRNGLAAGKSVTYSTTFPWPEDTNSHIIRCFVDVGDKIKEAREDNNELSKQFTPFQKDSIPPDTTITSGPSGTITTNSVTFEWIGSDNVTSSANLVYSYKLEGYDEDWSAFSSITTKTYSGLNNGSYSFKVKAKDQAGNSDPTPAERSFNVNVPTNIDFTWTRKADIPEPKSFPAIATLNGKIYLFGGCSRNRNYEYNPTTDTWRRIADLPDNFGIDEGGAAVVNNKIYVVGPQLFPTDSTAIRIYDPSNDSWDTGASIPNAPSRRGVGVVAFGGKVYAIGGADNNLNPINNVDVYDPITNTWISKAPLPTALAFTQVAVINNLIYVIGGRTDTGFSAKIEVYDPSTNIWSTKVPIGGNYAIGRYGSAVAILNNKIYLLGGRIIWDPNNSATHVDEYDPVANLSTQKSSLLVGRSLGQVGAVVNGKIYVIGGEDSNGTPLAVVEEGTPFATSSSAIQATLQNIQIVTRTLPNAVNFFSISREIKDFSVQIFDLSGQPVFHTDWVKNGFEWNLLNDRGQPLPNGVYLYVVTVRCWDGAILRNEVKKLVILR